MSLRPKKYVDNISKTEPHSSYNYSYY